MSETPESSTPEPRPCLAVGAFVVDGVRKAWLRCGEPAGHDAPRLVLAGETLPEITMPPAYRVEPGDRVLRAEPGTPHRVVLEWADDEAMRDDWPEAYDPAEPIDVDVPELDDDTLAEIAHGRYVDAQVDAEREARAWPDE